MVFEKPWTEKYRPKTLDEVVGRDSIVKRLKYYVEHENMPHLLFAGPAGVGKTTCAICLAHEFFGETWRQNFQETNASDERGINVVRQKIKEFARTRPIGGDFKIIFLDESDALTSDAQNALRRTMEIYTSTCRFILSCNYSSRIIEPIQSRCAVFRFGPLQDAAIKSKMKMISENEGLTITEDGMNALLYVAEGDMRKSENLLQAASAFKNITGDVIYQVSARATPEDIRKMMESALGGDFLAARKQLNDLLINKGLSGEDILRQMHREIFNLKIPDEKKVELVDKLGEHDFRLVEGSNEKIQLESLLAHFSITG
ncbi:MAG: replication factor C small subunit [Theionarchaea archaeon]|nr:replication factor C small subunit [Theionarchaea archaeon]MBU7000447.1 replication factor C small subunit [Theionarchaea archaeon]MBU7020026.1 replication factor C small subunit [Theionarchaea archaeon]MBU7035902.1 replication factor C small subunit [Theionarchaea archaeon]MBU7041592.1 replication factor C small subunit [Theionarchaea archaeon]